MINYTSEFNNILRDIMCVRCAGKVKRKCFEQTELKRFDSLIICLKTVMEPNDEKYPTKVPRPL